MSRRKHFIVRTPYRRCRRVFQRWPCPAPTRARRAVVHTPNLPPIARPTQLPIPNSLRNTVFYFLMRWRRRCSHRRHCPNWGRVIFRPLLLLPTTCGAAGLRRCSRSSARWPALQLFAQGVSDGERAAFAENLQQLVATGQVWGVATMRADLYDLLLKQPALKALKEAGASLDLGPPGPAELV